MTEQQANALFEKWVKTLKLGDWDINFLWKCDPKRMVEDAAGCTSYNPVCMQAVVEIADFELYESDMKGFEKIDYEQVLVHELLHLKFADVYEASEDPVYVQTTHRLLDQLARSFVEVARAC